MNILRRIEALRYDDPVASVELARHALAKEERLIPSLWIACELGSCLRETGQYEDALSTFGDILDEACSHGRSDIQSDALRRLAWTQLSLLDLYSATETAVEAVLKAAEADSRQLIGLGLVARAGCFYHSGRFKDSQSLLYSSIPYLHRSIDLAGVAINIYSNGKKLGTHAWLNVDPSGLPGPLRADLLWIEAEQDQGELGLAAMKKLLDFYWARNDWIWAAIAGVDVVERTTKLGRVFEAIAIVERLRPLVDRLGMNRRAEDAVSSLIQAVLLDNAPIAKAASLCSLALRSSVSRQR